MGKKNKNGEEEIDLGGFFNQIGRLIGKGFKGLLQLIFGLYNAIILSIIFIKNNYIKLSIGTVIAIALGILAHKYTEKTYLHEMVIIPNYESGSYIKNKLEYYNQLIEQKEVSTLSTILGIDPSEAKKILKFKLKSVKDNKDLIEGYDELVKKSDTTTIKELPLKNYLMKDFSEFNYKKYIIKMYSKIPSFKQNINNNLVKDLENNAYLNEKKELTLKSISSRDSSYTTLLKIIDTIIVQDKKIALAAANNTGGNSSNINLNNKENSNKDYELLELYKRTASERAYMMERVTKYNSLFQVVAPLEPVGRDDKSLFSTTFFKVFSLIMVFTVMAILFKPFLKYLNNYKKN